MFDYRFITKVIKCSGCKVLFYVNPTTSEKQKRLDQAARVEFYDTGHVHS